MKTPASFRYIWVTSPLAEAPDSFEALGARGWSSLEELQALWVSEPGTEPMPPRLRPGRAASFLVVSPAPRGKIDFNETDLTEVWLDGHKIERVP